MSALNKFGNIYCKWLSINTISICKHSHHSVSDTNPGENPSDESKKPESKRMAEFRKKLRETTPIEDLGEQSLHPSQEKKDVLTPWPNNTNPNTGEVGGPSGPEPTRYGDWERKGRCSDF